MLKKKERPISRPGRKRPNQGRFMLGLEPFSERILLSVTASFASGAGVLSVLGETQDNNIVVSRDAAGNILINGGAVAVTGGALRHVFTKETSMRSVLLLPAFVLVIPGLFGLTPLVSASENQARTRCASVRVLMPAGARLTINGKAPKNRRNRRFVTPQLEKGQKFTGVF